MGSELCIRDRPTNLEALKQSAESLLEPWVGDYYSPNLIGSTSREQIEAMDKVYDNLGIEKTKEEEEQTQQSLNEMVNTGLLGANKMLVEFAGINKFLGGVGIATKFNALQKSLSGGRWVKNGKMFSDASIKARAAAKGVSVGEYATGLGLRSVTSNTNKALQTLNAGLYEGAKFEAFTQFDVTKLKLKPEAGEQYGFSTGFGFGAMGRTIAPLSLIHI